MRSLAPCLAAAACATSPATDPAPAAGGCPEQVFAQAGAQGSTESLGATWTADTVEDVHEVTYDAHCVAPQTLAFEADNDDLFEDSDAP